MDESCKGEGKKLRLNIYGEIECECDDGWSYKVRAVWKRTKQLLIGYGYPLFQVLLVTVLAHQDGSCHQESTLAWCEQGELLQVSNWFITLINYWRRHFKFYKKNQIVFVSIEKQIRNRGLAYKIKIITICNCKSNKHITNNVFVNRSPIATVFTTKIVLHSWKMFPYSHL